MQRICWIAVTKVADKKVFFKWVGVGSFIALLFCAQIVILHYL